MRKQQFISYRSTIRDVYSVANLILLTIEQKISVDDAFLTSVTSLLKEKNTLLLNSINKKRTNSTLSSADAIRDKKTRFLFHLVQAFLLSDDETIKMEAQKADSVLSRYGINITNKSYSHQTVYTAAMLSDLDEIGITENIIVKAIEELRNAHELWYKSYETYIKQNIDSESKLSASKQSVVVKDIINTKLVPYMFSMSLVNSTIYGETFDLIQEIIENNNNDVRSHKKKIKLKSQVTEEDETALTTNNL